jgi:hypothetical protein
VMTRRNAIVFGKAKVGISVRIIIVLRRLVIEFYLAEQGHNICRIHKESGPWQATMRFFQPLLFFTSNL